MNSRFDYVRYDEKALDQQGYAKTLCQSLEQFMISELQDHGGTVSLALTKLEECYMWIGKAIRNNQIARTPADQPVELQEERKDG